METHIKKKMVRLEVPAAAEEEHADEKKEFRK